MRYATRIPGKDNLAIRIFPAIGDALDRRVALGRVCFIESYFLLWRKLMRPEKTITNPCVRMAAIRARNIFSFFCARHREFVF